MGKRLTYDSVFDYGSGIDSSSELARGNAIAFSKPDTLEGAAGANVQYETKIVSSQMELQKSLGISVAMSLKYGFVAGGDARAQITSDSSMTETSVAAVVHVKVAMPVLMIKDERIKADDVLNLYKTNPERFAEIYGDSYVKGIHTGGEMYGVIMFYSKDEKEKEALKLELSLKMRTGLTTVGIDSTVEKTTSEISSKTEHSVFVTTVGPTLDKYPEKPPELIDAAQKFPALVRNSRQAMPFEVDLMDYKYIGLPEGENLFDKLNKNEVIAFAGELKARAVARNQTILRIRKAIQKDPTTYPTANDGDLSIQEGKILELLDRIHTRVSECFNDYQKCTFGRDDLVLPEWTPPVPRQSIVQVESPISEKYKLCSFLGEPLPGEEEKQCLDGVGKYRLYEKGGIYWHPNYGAYSVENPIHDHYIANSSERSDLGYPIDDQKTYNNKVYSEFEFGAIVYNKETVDVKKFIFTGEGGQARVGWRPWRYR